MAIWIAPDSAEGVERAMWDRPANQTARDRLTGKDIPGKNRVGYQEYPKVLYRAGRPTMANVAITGSITVHDEQQELVAVGQGWCRTQEQAIQRVHDEHMEMATLAANRAWHDQRMSESARAEAEAREAAHDSVQHLPDLGEAPRRRGRPKKVQ